MKVSPRYPILLIVFGSLSLAVGVDAAPSQNDSTVTEIRQLYEDGSYSNAELEGRRLLDQPDISDSLRIQVEKIVAFSLIAQDKPQFAESHFWSILQRDSSFNLDPELISPKILSIFRKVRESFFGERRSLSPVERGPLLANGATYRTIVFPGWEQLYQGRTKSGYALLSAGALEVLLTVYCDAQRRSARDSYLQASTTELAARRYTKYNNFYKAEIYSAAAFGLTYLLSEVEVLTFGRDSDKFSAAISPSHSTAVLSLNFRF